MTDPRKAAIDWIRKAVTQELPGEDPNELLDLAWQFEAIATHHGIAIEELIAWLHDGRGQAANFSPSAFREHARQFAALQARLGAPSGGPLA